MVQFKLLGDDISFLNTIEEVSGYVFIHRVTLKRLSLPKLRIIRGEDSIPIKGYNFSLAVTQNFAPKEEFLSDIEFPALTGE